MSVPLNQIRSSFSWSLRDGLVVCVERERNPEMAGIQGRFWISHLDIFSCNPMPTVSWRLSMLAGGGKRQDATQEKRRQHTVTSITIGVEHDQVLTAIRVRLRDKVLLNKRRFTLRTQSTTSLCISSIHINIYPHYIIYAPGIL